jgi:hypothetical protein
VLIAGRCHCGNIAFALDWQPSPEMIPVRVCMCSYCRKQGAAWTAHASASLRVTIVDPQRAQRYAFETKTADFHVCTACGVVPFATSEIDGRCYAVVNVNTFEDVDPERLHRVPVSFDGEGESSRLSRRQRHWIGAVSFAS